MSARIIRLLLLACCAVWALVALVLADTHAWAAIGAAVVAVWMGRMFLRR